MAQTPDAPSHPSAAPPAPLTEQELQAIAVEAYLYGYPLVTMELTRRVMTNVQEPQGARAPLGAFAHGRERAGSEGAMARKGPLNPDMLTSSAWVDLRGEPYVLTVPEMGKSTFLLTLLDGWSTVFGTVNTFSKPAKLMKPGEHKVGGQPILLTGPGWRGETPEGMHEIKCSTGFAWLIAQFACTASSQEQEIHRLQDGLTLQPLSQYENPYLYLIPPRPVDAALDMTTPIREQVARLTATEYFGLLSELLKMNPPAADGELMAKLRRLGFVEGEEFDLSLYLDDPDGDLSPALAERAKEIYAAFAGAPARGLESLKEHFLKTCPRHNGWRVTTQTGEYGTNYPQRAAIAYYGLGAGRASDFLTGETQVDSRGRPLDGRYRYRVHFHSPPPVDAFWSLGLVDHLGNLVPSATGRSNLNSREGAQKNADGTVALLVQSTPPGGSGVHWLPAPGGRFALVLRLYGAQAGARDGSWKFPVVERIEPSE